MRRLPTLLLLAAGLGLSAARSEAQVVIYVGAPGDTAVGVFSGATASLTVSAYNPVYNYSGCWSVGYAYSYYCLSYAKLTFVYDPTLIESMAVDTVPGGFSAISSASGTGAFTVTASGAAPNYFPNLFRLHFRLAAGAHDGGFLWVRVDSLASPGMDNLAALQGGAQSQVAQVCHATSIWGDVDGNGRVDSRDALITLSAAVGLPVSGFSLGSGDVDGDGLTNSRDALMMLSYAIALPIFAANHVGAAMPDACPGLTAPGETVVFQRSQASAGGIFRLDPLSTAPVRMTANGSDAWPRLNAAGTKVAFQCMDPTGFSQVCLVDLAGTNRRSLTGPGFQSHLAPDWSPSGAKLAYGLQVGAPPVLYTMDSSGANPFQVGAVPLQSSVLAWSHDGTRLAYLDWNSNTVRTVTMDTTHVVLGLGPTGVSLVRWSPDDARVAYLPASFGPLWSVPAGGGTPAPLVTIAGILDFDWGPAGIVFSMALGSQGPSLWWLKGGPSGTLVRLTAAGNTDADHYPSFRRSP